MIMQWRLRPALPSDKSAINALFVEMIRTIYGCESAEPYEEAYLDRFFAGTGDWICVAETGSGVIGFLSIEEHHEDTDFLYLDDFSITAAWRGLGIGHAMLAEALRYARGKNISSIVLHVEKRNSAARRLYEETGFHISLEEETRYRMCLTVLPPEEPDSSR